MKLLLDKTIREMITDAGGSLQQQRQRDSGLSPREFVEHEARAVGPPSAESAGAPSEPEIVSQSAVTK
jgi:hypothetical protein